MRLDGIEDHNAQMHQVTKCLHDHRETQESGMKLSLSAGETMKQTLLDTDGQQTQMSLADLLQKLLRESGRRLLHFWNGSETAENGDKAEKSGDKQVMTQITDMNVRTENDSVKNALPAANPYFAAIAEPPKNVRQSFVQKLKLKCGKAAGQLARHLPGRFFQFQKKGSFQAGKEGAGRDLRKRSRYREDQLEIECVLTDESYLLDSYDRNGEYTQLTTKK